MTYELPNAPQASRFTFCVLPKVLNLSADNSDRGMEVSGPARNQGLGDERDGSATNPGSRKRTPLAGCAATTRLSNE